MTSRPSVGDTYRVPLDVGERFVAILGVTDVEKEEHRYIGGDEVLAKTVWKVTVELIDGRYRNENNRDVIADLINSTVINTPVDIEEKLESQFDIDGGAVEVEFST